MLPAGAEPPGDFPPAGLTYEQQKELLLLQLDRDKMDYDNELRRQALDREKLELERQRLKQIEEGRLGPPGPVGQDNVDVARNVRLLPKFEESNVETFFNLFECVADYYNWPDTTRILMLPHWLCARGLLSSW